VIVAPSAAPRRSSLVHAVVIDGEAVLLDERIDRLHHLNRTATLLWQLYDGATTLDELAHEISDVLGTDAAAVLADLLAITAHLDDEELLEEGAVP
jgi:hypothetical protein